jgi:MerR family redox-sensitive transcriptional activator SoxR
MTPATSSALTSRPLAEPTLTVSDLARAAGVAPSAVRFYESQGLITSERTRGNQRRFHHADECVVKIIRVAQRVGLSVAEIREHLADLPRNSRDITVDDFLRLRHRLEREARERIQALTAVLDDLTTDQKLCEIPPRKPSETLAGH